MMLAEFGGNLSVGLVGLGAAIGVGMTAAKASEAIGRNPEASGRILPAMILAMAFAEAIAIYSLIFAFR